MAQCLDSPTADSEDFGLLRPSDGLDFLSIHPRTEKSLYSPLIGIVNADAELDIPTHPRVEKTILTWVNYPSFNLQSRWPDNDNVPMGFKAVPLRAQRYTISS